MFVQGHAAFVRAVPPPQEPPAAGGCADSREAAAWDGLWRVHRSYLRRLLLSSLGQDVTVRVPPLFVFSVLFFKLGSAVCVRGCIGTHVFSRTRMRVVLAVAVPAGVQEPRPRSRVEVNARGLTDCGDEKS